MSRKKWGGAAFLLSGKGVGLGRELGLASAIANALAGAAGGQGPDGPPADAAEG